MQIFACKANGGSWTGVLNLKKDKPKKKCLKVEKAPAQAPLPRNEACTSWDKSLVQVSTTHHFPNFLFPWRRGSVQDTICSGVVVNSSTGLVLTTAGAVQYASLDPIGKKCQVLLRLPGSSRPTPAYVIAVSHPADLALLQTHALSALRRLSAVKWSTSIPELGRPVVLAGCTLAPSEQSAAVQSVGNIPKGTSNSTRRSGGCDRKQSSDQATSAERSTPQLHVVHGVVSRLEVVEYSISGASLLSYQVDAALRHNRCWGGGLFDAGSIQEGGGHCLGILFQRSCSEAWRSRYGPDVEGSRQGSGQGSTSNTCSSTVMSSDACGSQYGSMDSEISKQQSGPVPTSSARALGYRRMMSATSKGKKHGHSAPKGTAVHSRWEPPAPAACIKTCSGSSSSSSSNSINGRQRTQKKYQKEGTGTEALETTWSSPCSSAVVSDCLSSNGAAATCTSPAIAAATLLDGRGAAAGQTGVQKPSTDQGSVVHVVPACVVAHFLADIQSHGRCLGPPMPGFRYQATHAAALQRWLATGSAAADAATANAAREDPRHPASVRPQGRGMRVTSVPGRDCGWGPLREHDLITAIDRVPVAGDGTTEIQPGLHLSFTHLLASKQIGEEIAVSVVRGARQLELACRLNHTSIALLPRNPALSRPSSLPVEQHHSFNSNSSMGSRKADSAFRASASFSAPSVLFPWPAHLLVGHAAMTSLTVPALEQLYGAKAARRCEAAPWHMPGSISEGGRGRRVRDGERGQQGGWNCAAEGELWGGSNLVTVGSTPLGARAHMCVSKQAPGTKTVAQPKAVHACKDTAAGNHTQGFKGGNQHSGSCTRRSREIRRMADGRRGGGRRGRASSQRYGEGFAAKRVAGLGDVGADVKQAKAAPALVASIASAAHALDDASELILFSEVLKLPSAAADMLQKESVCDHDDLWPAHPDLLLCVNGNSIKSLRDLAILLGHPQHPQALEFEFASGHITVLDRVAAQRSAAEIASALGIEAYYLPEQ